MEWMFAIFALIVGVLLIVFGTLVAIIVWGFGNLTDVFRNIGRK